MKDILEIFLFNKKIFFKAQFNQFITTYLPQTSLPHLQHLLVVILLQNRHVVFSFLGFLSFDFFDILLIYYFKCHVILSF